MSSKSEETKKLILDTAFELMAQDGYAQTSISKIAKKAGISKGLTYHYFESKEALLKEIYHHFKAESFVQVEWPIDERPSERLKKLVDVAFYYLEHKTNIRKFSIALSLQSGVEEELKKSLANALKEWEDVAVGIFKSLGYYDPINEAVYLATLLDGIAFRYITSARFPLEEMKNLVYRNYKLA